VRWFFDHAETITEQSLERVKRLGGGIAIQDRMAFQGEYFVARYGAEAAKRTPPVTRMLELGIPGGGPKRVITDRALFDFDAQSHEMTLVELAPGETAETIQAEVGWPLKVSPNLREITPPTLTELDVIRQKLDPQGLYR
jgi:hypothetical protein